MAADLDIKQLRRFGLTVGGIIAGLFGAVLPYLLNYTFPFWPWIVGAVLAAWALAHPASLKPVFRGWMLVGHGLGWINSRVILGIAFLMVILPTAIAMRLARRDPLARAIEKDRRSYRVPSTNQPKKHFERPF